MVICTAPCETCSTIEVQSPRSAARVVVDGHLAARQLFEPGRELFGHRVEDVLGVHDMAQDDLFCRGRAGAGGQQARGGKACLDVFRNCHRFILRSW